MEILGDRNSYSKTDPDATFMRMKDDYMKNWQLKPGYNVQIATEGQYALAYDIFPNPTDTRTLIPFLDKIESQFFQLPKYIVADAGYGGEANYIDIIENRNRVPLITYNSYLREQKRKYKKDRFNTANWDYNEEHDYYVCPNGQKLTFQYYSQRTDRYGFKRKLKVYQSENCDGCPLRTFCTKAKEGNNRKLYVNETWEKQKEFFVAGSMTMVIPFISLYIESLEDFSDAYVQRWSGWVFAITFVTALIIAPIWGRIGDKYGRKRILIISATGLAVSLLLMGFATTIWQLFLLRFMMGVFTGFIPMSEAFISTQTPKEIAGRVLGTLQTGSVTGTLMGPLMGGLIADNFGYSATFKLVSITIFFSAFIVAFGIKEMQMNITVQDDRKVYSSKEVILHIVRHPVLLIVMLTSALVQIAHFSIQPILSLYVEELNSAAHVAFFAGLAFSATGLGNLLFTRQWGKLGDKFGYTKILIILLLLTGIIYFPGAFVENIWQLVILRFLLGMTIGGIIPARVAYIRQEAPLAMQGEVLGYNTSLRFLGNIIGPTLGGLLAGFYGISSIFFFTSGLLIVTGIIMLITWMKYENVDGVSLFHKK